MSSDAITRDALDGQALDQQHPSFNYPSASLSNPLMLVGCFLAVVLLLNCYIMYATHLQLGRVSSNPVLTVPENRPRAPATPGHWRQGSAACSKAWACSPPCYPLSGHETAAMSLPNVA